MEDYNKIIEALGVKFTKAKRIEVLQPVTVQNFYDVENTLILVNKGQISYGDNSNDALKTGDILFIPSGRSVNITYGSATESKVTNDLTSGVDRFFASSGTNPDNDNFSFISFEAKVFDSVNFFQSLDIPAFKIDQWAIISNLIREVISESDSGEPGKDRIVKLDTERMVVELIRYILTKQLFVEQLATNATYFKDPRLLDIFGYIRENLHEDLSNKTLSNVANVSEDYVGQYFKMLTGINPQDYIEYQRMEQAVHLLRTTKKSIREIGREVGYKDTAYFCRRFKMMFGLPAGKMRRRESLLNI